MLKYIHDSSKNRKDIDIVEIDTVIDIIEDDILEISKPVLDNLLKDRTTRKNIIWATDDYLNSGNEYEAKCEITIPKITGSNSNVIKPRIAKAKEHKINRIRNKAEVFTPSWVCNEQNNLIDDVWFGRKNIFNIATGNLWKTIKGNIFFEKDNKKSWKSYVDAKRLEISCGEAPYLVSRYDTVSGKKIPIEERVGLLDRKLRIVNENTDDEKEWYEWTKRAYQSIYGYEYQGDNLLLARENLLYTFIDNMLYKFNSVPIENELKEISNIISWNIWQMDGITMTVPFSERPCENSQIPLFDDTCDQHYEEIEPIPCKIFDWRANNSLEFRSMVKGGECNEN